MTHILEGTVLLESAVRRAIDLSASKYCPVNAMVSAGSTEVHHRFRMRCTGAEPHEAEGEVTVTGPDLRPDVVACSCRRTTRRPGPGRGSHDPSRLA